MFDANPPDVDPTNIMPIIYSCGREKIIEIINARNGISRYCNVNPKRRILGE